MWWCLLLGDGRTRDKLYGGRSSPSQIGHFSHRWMGDFGCTAHWLPGDSTDKSNKGRHGNNSWAVIVWTSGRRRRRTTRDRVTPLERDVARPARCFVERTPFFVSGGQENPDRGSSAGRDRGRCVQMAGLWPPLTGYSKHTLHKGWSVQYVYVLPCASGTVRPHHQRSSGLAGGRGSGSRETCPRQQQGITTCHWISVSGGVVSPQAANWARETKHRELPPNESPTHRPITSLSCGWQVHPLPAAFGALPHAD